MPARIGSRLRFAESHLWVLTSLTAAFASVATAAPVANVIPTTKPVWTAEGSTPGPYEEFGTSVAAAGDVNGDGFGDVIIGAPGWGAGLWRGRVLIFFGSPNGLSATPGWELLGEQDHGSLGYSVAGAGDVNGDGYGDVIVGEYGFSDRYSSQGRARIFVGSRRGIRAGPEWEVSGAGADDCLGENVASAGDVNGDGYGDVIIGSRSATMVFFGRPGRIERAPGWTTAASLGCSGIGDVNGDGFDDVALRLANGTLVYFGHRAGLSVVPSWSGPQALSVSGGGDVNGDGFGDLLLGPPSTTVRAVTLYFGSPSGPSQSPVWEARDSSPGADFFGLSVSTAGDVNGDGFSDVAVSAPVHFEGSVSTPSIFVYLGRADIPSARPDWRGTDGTHGIIRPVALGGDVDGDGSSEALFSDPNAMSSAGRVYLYRIGPGYPAPLIIHDPPSPIAPEGTPITLEARIIDTTRFLARAEIRYRLVEDFEDSPPVPMDHIEGDLYRGTIPPPSGFSSGLVYSICGIDDHGVLGQTELSGVEYVSAAAAAATRGLSARVRSIPGAGGPTVEFVTHAPGLARVRMFDVAGRLVAVLLDAPLEAGLHRIDLRGHSIRRSGVFFYSIETADGTATGRLVHLR